MDNNAKILVVIPIFRESISQLLSCLEKQTLKPAYIVIVAATRAAYERLSHVSLGIGKVIYVKPVMQEHIGVRVGKAINTALRQVCLEHYDFLLKLDADVLLPSNYLARCVTLGADLVGLGPFMLVKIKPFLTLLHGQWPETPADDAFIATKFRAAGLKVERWLPGITIKTGGSFRQWRYYYLRGMDDFKLGFDPFQELVIVQHLIRSRHSLLPMFTLLGYVYAFLWKREMYDFGALYFKKKMMESLGKLLSIKFW
jgi:hypothetical protein